MVGELVTIRGQPHMECVMKERKQLIPAISAAVMAYIKSQEEQQLAFAEAVPVAAAPISVSLWPASGRQAMMEMRRLLQLRMIR